MKRPEPDEHSQHSIKARSVQKILVILHKWGIHSLGQLAALDKEELSARFGPEAVRLWERANGQFTRLLKLVQLPESFEESFEFEHEIETAEPLLFMLRRFLEQLGLRLSTMYLVAKELHLRITFSNPPWVRHGTDSSDEFIAANKQVYERSFKIPQPTNDVDLLFRMLHTHLEDFKSEYPIVAVSLTAEPIKPPSQQFGLFEMTLRNPQQLYETLARLTALLGAERIGKPVVEETHRSDAFQMEPFSWSFGGTAESCPLVPLISKPALRRFRPVTPASVLNSDNFPAHVQSEKIFGKVINSRGPYLLSGNWWDEKSWARAEWDLQLDDGELVRCYESPPSVAAATVAGEATWKIDGIYD
jgi:impB/mucB/samB family protein